MEKKIVKTRMYRAQRMTVYYYSDGTKSVRYWESIDSFSNKMGI